MDFDPSEEQSIALDAFRRFVEAEIAPAVQTWRDATIPKDLAHALLRKLAPHGVGSGWLAESNGGLALKLVTSVLILPQRQTAVAAKQIATIDLLSGGRLMGRGGHRLELRRIRGSRHRARDAGGF
jgi:alkylation response protein AidB-like acyl-CoA dehydrogenase